MPSSQQIQVGLKFFADTSQAKQQIQSLQQTLQQIGNTPIGVTGGSIESAVQSAKQLEIALQKAVNVDTGKLNFSALNKSLASMGTNVTEVGNKLLSMGPQGQKAFQQLAQSISQAEIPARKLNGVLGRFADTLLRTIRWQVASSMIHGFISTVKSAVGYIEDLDKSLNSIQRITQKNDAEMANFAKTANKMAGQLSTVTKEYSNASLIFFQQGLDTAEVIERTNATIKLAKVTGDSVENISSKLTAIWNNFDDGTKSLEYYADVITKLGASTASSSDEIATGLQKFAAVADTVGLSYERATAALATVVAQTRQSAEIVGTSFKTIFARVEGLKLGETLEDDVTLNQYSAALAKIGVDILDSNNNLKDMDTILDDLGDKWNKLTEAQKVATAQTVAGVRQYSQFLALMDNYEQVRANEDLAKDSKGTLDKQFKTYQESIEALDKEIEKAKQDIFASLFNADDLKGFKESLVDVLGSVQKIVSAVGGLKGIINFITALLLERAIPSIQTGVNNIVTRFKTFRVDSEAALSSFQILASQQAGNASNTNIKNSISNEKSKNIDENYVTVQQQSMYYTNQILILRQKLLENSQNMTNEQRQSIQAQIDYLSGLGETAVKERNILEALKQQRQEYEAIVAEQNRRQAYNEQNEKNKQSWTNKAGEATVTKGELFEFQQFDNTKVLNAIDGYINKYQVLQKEYQEMASDKQKYSKEEIQSIQNRVNEINKYIEKLEEVQDKMKSNKTGGKAEVGQILKQSLEQEQKFRQKLQPQMSAGNAGLLATQETYEMNLAVNENTDRDLRIASGAIAIDKDQASIVNQILQDIGMIKTEAEGIDFNEAGAKSLSNDLSISQKSIKDLASKASQYNNISRKASLIQKDISANLKRQGNLENIKNKNSKAYQKTSEAISKEQKNIVNSAREMLKTMDKNSDTAQKLGEKLQEAENSIGKEGSTKAFSELETTLKEVSTQAETTGTNLNNFGRNLVNSLNVPPETKQALLGIITSQQEIDEKTRQAAEAQERFNQVMQSIQAPTGLQSFAQGLGTVIQVSAQGIQAFQMMTSGVNMLSDAFSGNGDIVSTLSGLMMTLKGLMVAYNVVQTISMTIGRHLIKQDSEKIKLKAAQIASQKKLNAEETAGVATAIWRKSVEQLGAVAGVAFAGIATAGMIASVAISASSKKSAAAAQASAEAAEQAAEASQKRAEAAKEEYEELYKAYTEYEKLYTEYQKTKTGKDKLYESSMDLIKKYGEEGDAILVLTGRYQELIDKIKETVQAEFEQKKQEDEYNTKRSKTAFEEKNATTEGGYRNANFQGSEWEGFTGLLEYRGEEGEERFKQFALSLGYTDTDENGNPQSIVEFLQKQYKDLKFDENYLGKVAFANTKAGIEDQERFLQEYSKFNQDFIDKYKKDRDEFLGYDYTKRNSIFVELGGYTKDSSGNDYREIALSRSSENLWFKDLTSILSKMMGEDSFEALVQKAKDNPNSALYKLLTESNDLDSLLLNSMALYDENSNISSFKDNWKEFYSLLINPDTKIATQINEIETSGQKEALDKWEASIDEEINNLITEYSNTFSLPFANTVSILDSALDFNEENNNRYKQLLKDYATKKYGSDSINRLTDEDKKVVQDSIMSNVPDYLANLYKIGKDFGFTGAELDKIAKDAGISLYDLADYIQNISGNFDIGFYSDEEAVKKAIKGAINQAQKIADSNPIELSYATAQSAAKDWKKDMSFDELQAWQDKYYEALFGPEGILTNQKITFEDFSELDFKEQSNLLSNAVSTKDMVDNIKIQREAAQEAINAFENRQSFRNEKNEEILIEEYLSRYLNENDNKTLAQQIIDSLIENGFVGKDISLDNEDAIELANRLTQIYNDAYKNYYEANINKINGGFSAEAWKKFADVTSFKNQASNLNLDIDETYDYLKYLQSINEELRENPELAKKVALAVKAQEKGFKDASDHLEDYLAVLKQGDKTTAEYAKQLNLFQEDLSLLFNREDLDNSIAQIIFDDTIAMDLFKQAIEGSDEAWQQFQVRATMLELGIKDFDTSLIDEYLTELANQDIEIGATIEVDEAPFLNTLYQLLVESGKTADEISSIFSNIGYEPEFDYKTVYTIKRQTARDPETGELKTIEFVEETRVPFLKGARKTSISKPASTLAPKKDNSGGGSERSKKEPKKSEDEIERYHRLNKTLDSLSKQYSRISSAKDAAFGAQRLKYIEQENKLLQQQYNTEKALLKEIEQNYSKDRSAIEAYGAIIDQNGVITNYDQIMKQQLDKLNSAYAQYNAGGLSDEIIEAREKEYEEFKKILSQFEETNNTYLDQLEKVEEAIRKQITNALEGIKAKVELELELPNQQLKMIEYKLQDLENRAFSSSEKIALWSQQAEIAANSFSHYADAFRNVLTMSVYDAESNKTGGFGLTADQANRLMSGDAGVLDEAGITGENAQEIMEALKEYQDNLLDEYSKVREARQSIEEELLNQLNEYTEAIDQQISKLEKLNSIANNYKTLINTTGKELLGISADIMNSINATIMNTSKNQMAALKAEQDALEANLVEAREKLANALASGDSEAIQYWKNVNQEIENTLLETKDTLLSTINDFVESATEILQERIKESFDNFAKQIYGMTFEDAQASYDRYKTLSDDYLKDYQKIYELSKLTRQVEQSIDNTNNIKSKQILRDLQAEINEYQAEGVQMTQYEVDYLNKKYELRKAEIALQEAQNAKDQVRLSRNADGGWGHVYTANQQNIDKAQQSYEDKLYALQELNTKAIENTQATILQLQTEYQNAIMEIWANKELSPEQISARVDELTDYYTGLINTQSKTLNSALENNNELYTEDWKNYNELTGYRISADENYIDKFEETWLGKQQQGIMSALDFFELYKNTIGTYDNSNSILGQCYSAFEDYSNMVRDSLSSAGLDLEEFAFVVSNEMNKIEESSKKAKDEGENLANLLSKTLPNTMNEVESVQEKTTNMLNNMKLAIDGVNNALTLLIQKLQEYNDTTITKKTFTPPESAGPTAPYVAPAEGLGDDGDKNPSGDRGGKEKYYILKKHPKKGFEWFGPNEYAENFFDKNYYKKNSMVVAYATPEEKEKGKLHYTFEAADYSDLANEIILWLQKEGQAKHQYIAYDTGGYTGAFGPEGRLAMLHEKELVLNKQDTSNMLKMIDIARQVIYDFNSSLPNFTAQTLSNALFDRSNGETNQNITIEAHFPNAVNHLEIEEAFRNLANYSAQNAYNLDLSQNINIF